MSGFGGGRNSGGGRGRGGRNSGGRGRGGRGRGRNNNYQGGNSNKPQVRVKHCVHFAKGTCQNGDNCQFRHVLRVHGVVDVTSPAQNNNNNNYNSNYNNNNNKPGVSSVAIWENQGAIKIFTGSKDGFWRLWNTANGQFVKEYEQNMNGEVDCLVVESNFLFCGFSSQSPALPEVNVGMIHAWNLNNPADPPSEFHMHAMLPYAHATCTSKLIVEGTKVVSGAHDGSIRLWAFDNAANGGKGGFGLTQSLLGHAREVTGLSIAGNNLWSCSTDGAIRIWDIANGGVCQHAITMSSGPNPQQPLGHTNAVTCLLSFTGPSGLFILSGSLDGTVKAWNAQTGECVGSTNNNEGVVSMSLCDDPTGSHQLLLIGLESGSFMFRNLLPTGKIQQAFEGIMYVQSHPTWHTQAIKALAKGPTATFYTGGSDGKMLVGQLTGDLGL